MGIDIEVQCADCGKELEIKLSQKSYSDTWVIIVTPCEHCMEKEHKAGFNEGASAAEEELNQEIDRLKGEVLERMELPEKFAKILQVGTDEDAIKATI
jgi:hypothetical protein